MNARETVMSKEQLQKLHSWLYESDEACLKCLKVTCEHQADLSFKEGMRTIVKWVEQHEEKSYLLKIPYYSFGKDKWQAQLKEWGLG